MRITSLNRGKAALLPMTLVLNIASQAHSAVGVPCTDPTNYCTASVNSTGSGAVISWSGTASPVNDNFYLVTMGAPAGQPLLYYYGATQVSAPFGNGVRCVGAGGVGTFRFQPMAINGAGMASMKVDFAQAPVGGAGLGVWTPGDTWYCQGWYRDPAAGGASFNLTNGLAVQVCAGGADPYIGMSLVPAGGFDMGDHSGNGVANELPVHPVTLEAFYMNTFEVTNQEYADYLNAAYVQGRVRVSLVGTVIQVGGAGHTLCDTSGSSSFSRITWNGSSFGVTAGKADHPMVDVSWHGAAAYANGRSRALGLTPSYNEATWACDFDADGFRLPTEAEWEYAVRGGEQAPYYRYSWGDLIDGSKANYWNSGDPYDTAALPRTTPVGYFDGNQTPSGSDMVNGYGLHDMAGNVLEWCNDWYFAYYYASSPVSNPRGPESGSLRVFRGGSWFTGPAYLRSANRFYSVPTSRHENVGFRIIAVSP